MDDVAAWFLALYKTTGIKLTIFYDGYDRARFFQGFVTTVKLSAYCLVLSLVLGALAAWLTGSRVAVVRRAVTGFVALFRNTPPLVQLYFFYFALGPLVPKVDGAPLLGSFGWAVVSLTLLETAFAAEIYRAGIEAIHKGQMEAALTLGMTPARAMQYIILPQAVRTMLPPMTTFAITLLKDTALVSVVAAPEIMFYARNLVTESFLSMHVYLIAALIYLSMTIPMARIAAALERSKRRWQ